MSKGKKLRNCSPKQLKKMPQICKQTKRHNRITDEMESYAQRVFGKPYSKLTDKEKDKAYFWAKDIVAHSK